MLAFLAEVYALYYRRKEDYENFYKSSLQFLAYTAPGELSNEENKDWSIKIGMAVLLGKTIYNITELLDKDILNSLLGTDFEWLYHLLQTVGQGKINDFDKAIQTHQDYISRFPNIMKEMTFLQQKVRIIAFLEMLFACGKDDRSLTFERIAKECQVEKVDVELLVMKAMSLELIRGTIDEVEEIVHVDWILPHYLNKGHMEILVDRLREWEQKMDNVVRMVEDGSQELLIK